MKQLRPFNLEAAKAGGLVAKGTLVATFVAISRDGNAIFVESKDGTSFIWPTYETFMVPISIVTFYSKYGRVRQAIEGSEEFRDLSADAAYSVMP